MNPSPKRDSFTQDAIAPATELEAALLMDSGSELDALQHGIMPTTDLADELALASMIQQSLLPKHFPIAPGFTLAGYCQSARELGGDFYDALSLGDGRVLLAVADVMGKGVPAALFAASLRMLIRSLAEREHSPAELLASINRQMYSELSSVDMFITAQLALADTQHGILRVAGAGHCPLLVADSLGVTRAIAPHGLPLGIEETASFGEAEVALDNCLCALLYTDGLTESRNPEGDFFGVERLETWLAFNADGKRTAAELGEGFMAELSRFQRGSRSRDDLTLIVLAREAKHQRDPGSEGHSKPAHHLCLQ